MNITDIATIILAVATTSSLIYISRQVTVTRLQTKGQFLLALDDQFAKAGSVNVRLVREPNLVPHGEDWIDIWRLMSIYERINIMVEDRILDVALVDRLYGSRLVGLLDNEAILDSVKSSGAEWQDFIDLCHAIADNRLKGQASERDQAFSARVRQLSKDTRTSDHPFRIPSE